MALIIGYDLLIVRLHTLTTLDSELSFQSRLQVWQDTLYYVRDFPIIGSGLGTFAHTFPRYQSFSSEKTFFYSENDYLQLLAETGTVGSMVALSIGSIFFFTVLKAWKKRTSRWSIILVTGGMSSLVSLLIHTSVDFNLHIPSNALLFCVIAALSYISAYSHRRTLQ